MSCYDNVNAIDGVTLTDENTIVTSGGTISTTSSALNGSGIGYVKNYQIGKLTDSLIKIFQESVTYPISPALDWRWLAAFASVESNFKPTVTNSYGYYGLFQFKQSTICKGKTIYSVKDQSDCTAERIKNNFTKIKKKYKADDETCILYSAVAHNAGDGAAALFLEAATVKNIAGIINTVRSNYNLKWPKNWYKLTEAKRKEISNYPIKVKSAYIAICGKYRIDYKPK